MTHSQDRPAKLENLVSRAGSKLAWALDRFCVQPAGMVCADLGANVGGFTQVLLARAAARVYAIDTGYGVLDYSLRRDARVVVMERTNALHVTLPELCDLAVIDLGWTRQRLSLPKAAKLIKPACEIISLVKPQYEAPRGWTSSGVLTADQAEQVFSKLLSEIPSWGMTVAAWCPSPISGKAGNREFLVQLRMGS